MTKAKFFVAAALLATAVACSGRGGSTSTPASEATPTIDATTASPTATPATAGIALTDSAERERVRAALGTSADVRVVPASLLEDGLGAVLRFS